MELGRWELLRALGRVAADPAAAGELGLPPVGTTEHDEVFTVNCPPFASLYLGEPAEPDHLAGLLDRYAGLGEAGEDGRVLFREFLWPWLPAYLGAVRDLPDGPLTGWADLTLDALRRERDSGAATDGPLPRALREAPPPVRLGPPVEPVEPAELVEGLLTPRRSGMILTRRAVAAGAERVGAGQRIGNRRRALSAMLAAEPELTAAWLASEADRWTRRHQSAGPDPVQAWWAERAAGTARVLRGTQAPDGVDAPDDQDTAGGGREADWVGAAD